MKVALVDADPFVRREIVEVLQVHGVSVASFSDPHTAFLFVLGRLHELDGVLVNDDCGRWSPWLRARVELLSTPLPVASYSGQHPERETKISGGAHGIDVDPCAQAPTGSLEHLAASVAAVAGAARAATPR